MYQRRFLTNNSRNFLIYSNGWKKTTLAYHKEARTNWSGSNTCGNFMSTVIKMADAEKISTFQIRLDATDKLYQNDTEEVLRENMKDKSRKCLLFFLVLKNLGKWVQYFTIIFSSFSYNFEKAGDLDVVVGTLYKQKALKRCFCLVALLCMHFAFRSKQLSTGCPR